MDETVLAHSWHVCSCVVNVTRNAVITEFLLRVNRVLMISNVMQGTL